MQIAPSSLNVYNKTTNNAFILDKAILYTHVPFGVILLHFLNV